MGIRQFFPFPNHARFASFLLTIIFTLSIFLLIFFTQDRKGGISTITFTPSVIPYSAPEIANPWRSAQYYGDESPPPNWPLIDHYNRLCWNIIEPEEGRYNFAPIERVLADAKAHGGKGGFSIMPTDPSHGGSCVPPYLMALMPHSGWYTNSERGLRTYIPDWNDPHYLTRLSALLTALSQHFGNDPRFGWVDLFAYGSWNEWNLAGFPSGVPVATPATKQAIINMNIEAFPNQRIVMDTDAHLHDRSNYDALSYALSLSQKIGLRMNCLGKSTMGGAVVDFAQSAAARNRWITAPTIVEYCDEPDFQEALNQIKQYHFAMIGDGAGNVKSFSSYSPSDQYLMMLNYKISGYRFVLNSLTLPSQIESGGQITVVTKWSNFNVTPAYNPWNIMLQLRNAAGSVVWQGKSRLDLQTLLPTTNQSTGIDTPITVSDSFTLPNNIPNSIYSVSLQVVDPYNYYFPLKLAIQGRSQDGSYPLGTIGLGVKASPTTSISPTPTSSIGIYTLPINNSVKRNLPKARYRF